MEIKDIFFQYPEEKERLKGRLAKREKLYDRNLIASIRGIFDEVEKKGDAAVLDATSRFDKADLNSVRISPEEADKALREIPESLKQAAGKALGNIVEVNRALMPQDCWIQEIRPGTYIGEKNTPLESVGLWVPARKGVLISTALMLIGAAKTAGVKRIMVGMPPSAGGGINRTTLGICRLAGADDFFVGNGVGIIAGWAAGTESIPKAGGIFGPGPGGIAAAMAVAFSFGVKTVLGIGPTDSVILVHGDTNIKILAYDLLNEAEHGKDSSSVLVTTDPGLPEKLCPVIEKIIAEGPIERREILEHSFGPEGLSAMVTVPTLELAVEFINDYAPEHMNIRCPEEELKAVLGLIRNAGEILIGEYTPFTAGNYAIGVTAVLPTNSFAKNTSGITCRDMMKTSTIGRLNKNAFLELAPVLREISVNEDLPFHGLAAEIRESEGNL